MKKLTLSIILGILLLGMLVAGTEYILKDIGLKDDIDYKDAGVDEVIVNELDCDEFACNFVVDIVKKGDGKDINDSVESMSLTILREGKSNEQLIKDKDELAKLYTELKAKDNLKKAGTKEAIDSSYSVQLPKSKGIMGEWMS